MQRQTACREKRAQSTQQRRAEAETEEGSEGRERGRRGEGGERKGDEPLGQQRGMSASAIWPRRACLAGLLWD